MGRVSSLVRKNQLLRLGVSSDSIFKELRVSESVAVNGACLTLVEKQRNILFFETIESTLKKTNLKRLRLGDYVNLEPALKLGQSLSGHFVLGHIDKEVRIIRLLKKENYRQIYLELPSAFKNYLVENGSVAMEGISLTVKSISNHYFSVEIIPFTYKHTNLQFKKTGDWVNVEFDYLLKNKMQILKASGSGAVGF